MAVQRGCRPRRSPAHPGPHHGAVRLRTTPGMEAVTGVGEAAVVLGRQLEVGGGGVGFQLRHARRPGDDDDVAPPDEPGEGHLGRRGAVVGCDLLQGREQLLDPFEVLRSEQGVAGPYAAGRVRRVVLAGQQALSERAVRNDQAVLAWAQPISSRSGPRAARLYCTWLDSTGPPKAA